MKLSPSSLMRQAMIRTGARRGSSGGPGRSRASRSATSRHRRPRRPGSACSPCSATGARRRLPPPATTAEGRHDGGQPAPACRMTDVRAAVRPHRPRSRHMARHARQDRPRCRFPSPRRRAPAERPRRRARRPVVRIPPGSGPRPAASAPARQGPPGGAGCADIHLTESRIRRRHCRFPDTGRSLDLDGLDKAGASGLIPSSDCGCRLMLAFNASIL